MEADVRGPIRSSDPDIAARSGNVDRDGPRGDDPPAPVNEFLQASAPALDSLDDQVMRQRLHAELFGGEPGVWIDRFELLDKLGAGGMGSVWAARDHRLGRRVALKFLRSNLDGSIGEQRLFREAQALGRLAHPNVVSVFDVGRHEGRVWIAMELVPGRTLAAWGSEQPRPQRQVLARWLAAGEGLAAIHEAGLVHRDVKPDNLLVGDDGRVRVIDLGLVRATGDHEDLEFEETVVESGPQSLDSGTLREGVTRGFVGTPAYASPEQLRGQPVDARSDQYSFCVSVWEALTGRRPQPDESPAASRGMSRRVHRALRRGMAAVPEARFGHMRALLDALAPPGRRKLVPAISSLGLIAALAAGFGGAFDRREATQAVEPCATAGAEIDGHWSPEHAAVIRERFGDPAAGGLVASFDQWAESWRRAAVDSCEAVHVRHVRSEASLDQRSACLELAARGLDGLLAAVADGELDSPTRVTEAFGQLDDPQDCASEAGARQAIPEQHADQIAAVREALGRAKLGLGEPRLDARIARVEAWIVTAADLGWTPLVAEAQLVLGYLHKLRGDARAARSAYGAALDIADELADPHLATQAWGGLDLVALHLDLDLDAAQWALARLDGAVTRLGSPPRQRGWLAVQRGVYGRLANEPERAEIDLREAIAAFEQAGPIGAWGLAGALRALADLQRSRGDDEGAAAALARARVVELGGHPGPDPIREGGNRTRSPSYNEGVAALGAGDLDEARRLLERALTESITESGPRGFDVARVHVALAAVHDAKGELERCRDHAERADAIYVDAGALAHPRRTNSLTALGTVAFRAGRFEDAVTAYERALVIDERILAPDSPRLAIHSSNLGEALHAVGQRGRARAALERARVILEPLDHPDLAWPLRGLGAVALDEADYELARRHLSRAVDGLGEHPLEQARARALLARAEAGLGEHELARALARDAAEALERLGDPVATEAAELRAEFELRD